MYTWGTYEEAVLAHLAICAPPCAAEASATLSALSVPVCPIPAGAHKLHAHSIATHKVRQFWEVCLSIGLPETSQCRADWVCWCRVFCQLLRPDLDRVLAQQPPARGPLLNLFYAVHQMERRAQRFFPSALGARSTLPPCCCLILVLLECTVSLPVLLTSVLINFAHPRAFQR